MSQAIIQALDGAAIDVMNPRPEWFTPRTAAHALSQKNRFCGQAKVAYTVADHSTRVSRMFADPLISSVALWHEGDEIFLPDVPGPLKRAPEMTWYRALCDRHMAACMQAFGLPWPWPAELKAAIKAADLILLATEARDLTANAAFWLHDVEPLPETIHPLSADVAEQEMLARYRYLNALRRVA